MGSAPPDCQRYLFVLTGSSPFRDLIQRSFELQLIAEIFGITNVGLIRHDNQDAFLIANLETGDIATMSAPSLVSVHTAPFILIVADGVGGAASGALASSIATETILDELHRWWHKVPKRTPESVEAALKRAIDAANRAIFQRANASPEHRGMGTTTTLTLVLDSEAYIAQVGDSRAYLVRKGAAKQVTKDQSFVQRLIDAGRMTAKEAAESEHRNIILQALGPEEKVVTDFYRVKLENDDYLILCSDGLSNQVSAEEIARIARGIGRPKEICEALVEEAMHTGAPDNITVVTARLRTPEADYRRAVSGG
jgi:protein phosphatase